MYMCVSAYMHAYLCWRTFSPGPYAYARTHTHAHTQNHRYRRGSDARILFPTHSIIEFMYTILAAYVGDI